VNAGQENVGHQTSSNIILGKRTTRKSSGPEHFSGAALRLLVPSIGALWKAEKDIHGKNSFVAAIAAFHLS